ncbi:hypothetical protein F0562_017604 [Nyssa sinensis]|uniref:Alpha 1,4-glycosyltransferase domain-containing protein n=1 Tax=Nyssa sinensis TaxID=561372 RepID=A0A5J4ZJB8_9ASTE|nr:hypothetical protein F0562_017604 [Nyssa sinensis]
MHSLPFNFLRPSEEVIAKMFDFRSLNRAKLPIFSTISFAAIFLLIIFADSFISNLSLHSVAFGTKRTPQQELQTHNKQKLKSTSTQKPLLLVKEEVEVSYGEVHNHLVPPFNVSREERIAWFKRKFPEFEIFESSRLTSQFDSRVREFFGHGCEIQFFMTWISPAKSFGRREFLAMESLFKAHPRGCLTILSKTMDSVSGYRILEPLLERGFRALAVTPDLSFLFKDTPAEAWFNDIKTGKRDPGEIPLAQNLSNLIRLAILYKYGGIYLDTDFIVLKDFSGMRNSIGAQSIDAYGNWTRLNNAVLVFDKNHPLLYKFIEEFASTFDGNRWGHNGPYLVSRVVERSLATKALYNFTILPPIAFYPVDWSRIPGFFVRPNTWTQTKWVEAKLLQLSGGATYGGVFSTVNLKLFVSNGRCLNVIHWSAYAR